MNRGCVGYNLWLLRDTTSDTTRQKSCSLKRDRTSNHQTSSRAPACSPVRNTPHASSPSFAIHAATRIVTLFCYPRSHKHRHPLLLSTQPHASSPSFAIHAATRIVTLFCYPRSHTSYGLPPHFVIHSATNRTDPHPILLSTQPQTARTPTPFCYPLSHTPHVSHPLLKVIT